MPVNITTPQTKTLYVDESNQGWVLTSSGSITVANGHGIVNNDAFHDSTITVAGSIVADGMYKCGIFSNGPSATLKIETGGSIHGYGGISFYGEGTHVENLGKITAVNAGIYGNAAGSEISNAGTIDAKYGIYVDGPEFGAGKMVTNSGVINADYGVLATQSSFQFTNTANGAIHSNTIGVSLGGNDVLSQNKVVNYGLIESSGLAIQGSVGKDDIINHGTIKGSVELGAGNDTFDNRDGTMTYTVNGGDGDDTYVFGAKTFTIIEGGGNDTIGTNITRTLADFTSIENLYMYGQANINGTGNVLVNFISGNNGNNILDGGVDKVTDTLSGGAGNDVYILGSGTDVVIDTAGHDTITSTITRSLANYATIEDLELKGTANINATGNALANVIVGNAGNNILDGGNDNVVDTLMGDWDGISSNDTYVLRAGFDLVIDEGGTDTITSTISRSLVSYSGIENLTLVGNGNGNATGNALANVLTGNSGTNNLSGGAGNDVLIGGAGADKLDGGANTDTASYKGAAAGVVANLANASANTEDAKGDSYVSIENLAGSSHNDTLTGNSGVNALYGSAGADKLTGGAGADTFLFKATGDSTVATTGQDTIFDFSHAQGDKIGLSGIDANTAMSGDQAFVFKGTAAFSGGKGELHFNKQASDTYVYGDINGDKVADFVLHFDDAIAFQANDFIL